MNASEGGNGRQTMTATFFILVGLGLVGIGVFLWSQNFSEGSHSIPPANNILIWVTAIIAIANVLLVCLTYMSISQTRASLRFANTANERSEKLFVGQNMPLIDVTPMEVIQEGTQAMTTFTVQNYSGFKAYKIGLDLKYGDHSWILEWRKASDEKSQKRQAKGVVADKFYSLSPQVSIEELGPGESIDKDKEGKRIGIKGALNMEKDVCGDGKEGMPVLVRVSWQNENQHTFDEIHAYTMLCTTAGDGGRAFTFVPQGIVSKKDLEVENKETT
jgi:hypothetical protein